MDLYNVLANNRDKLLDIYEEIYDYPIFSKIISDITTKYDKCVDVWNKLSCGMIGDKDNKFSVIYEYPTRQLVDVIILIAKMYNVRCIDEVGAGIGLLTAVLEKRFGKDKYYVKITASDNNSSELTSVDLDYTRILKKDITDIILQHKLNIYPPDMVLCAWHSINMEKQFNMLIKEKCVKIFIFICKIDDNYDKLIAIGKKNGYDVFRLPIYQVSHYDYPNDVLPCRSITYAFVMSNKLPLDKLLKNYTYEEKVVSKKKISMLDMCYVKKFPKWGKTLDDNQIEKISKMLFITKHTKMPMFIPNQKIFTFWFIRTIAHKFPLNITTEQDIIKYYDLVIDMSEQKMTDLVEKKILPPWIKLEYVDYYLWLEFSTSNDTKWKTDLDEFLNKYKTY